MKTFKYYAILENLDNLQFDCNYFNSIKKIKEWAKDRSGIYDLTIHYVDEQGIDWIIPQGYYQIKNNRIYSYKL